MKHCIGLLTGIFFLFCLQIHAYGGGSGKFGVVDIQKFQQNSAAFQKVKEDYIGKLEPARKELEKEKAELISIEEELRKQSMMLSLDANEGKRKELGQKTRRYKYLENEFLQEMKEMEVETVRIVGAEIQEIVTEIGKRDGYIMILEKRAVGFLYNDEKIDITDEVIKAYDKKNK